MRHGQWHQLSLYWNNNADDNGRSTFNLWRKILNILSEHLNRIMKRCFTCQWFFHLTFSYSLTLSLSPLSLSLSLPSFSFAVFFVFVWSASESTQYAYFLSLSRSLAHWHSIFSTPATWALFDKHNRLCCSHRRSPLQLPLSISFSLYLSLLHTILTHISISIGFLTINLTHRFLAYEQRTKMHTRTLTDTSIHNTASNIPTEACDPQSLPLLPRFSYNCSRKVPQHRSIEHGLSKRFCQVESIILSLDSRRQQPMEKPSMSSAHRSTAEWSNSARQQQPPSIGR